MMLPNHARVGALIAQTVEGLNAVRHLTDSPKLSSIEVAGLYDSTVVFAFLDREERNCSWHLAGALYSAVYQKLRGKLMTMFMAFAVHTMAQDDRDYAQMAAAVKVRQKRNMGPAELMKRHIARQLEE